MVISDCATGPFLQSLFKLIFPISPRDTIGDFKKLVAAQIGTEARKIVLKKWYKEFKDHITLDDCE